MGGMPVALGFAVDYRFEGAVRRSGLAGCGDVGLEDAEPFRRFRFSKSQLSFAGWWWLSTTGCHVGYESFVERDHVMLLDFDPDVTGVVSQPFRLRWRDGSGKRRRHVPDYFARMRDGRGVVIDVRPDDRIRERDAEVFAVTALACGEAGWEFRRVGRADRVLAANVRWLSRYRHPRCSDDGTAAALAGAFAEERMLFAGAAQAGGRLGVLPVLFHLMWRQALVADLASGLLGPSTLVRAAR